MTPRQQTLYWKKYARQNARYERKGVAMFDKAIQKAVAPIISHIYKHGATLDTIDLYFDETILPKTYTAFYIHVGVLHKAITEVIKGSEH